MIPYLCLLSLYPVKPYVKFPQFVLLTIKLIFSVLLQIHISRASSLVVYVCVNIHVSAAYAVQCHTPNYTRFFNSKYHLPVNSLFLSINNFCLPTIAILLWISHYRTHPQMWDCPDIWSLNSLTCSTVCPSIWIFILVSITAYTNDLGFKHWPFDPKICCVDLFLSQDAPTL